VIWPDPGKAPAGIAPKDGAKPVLPFRTWLVRPAARDVIPLDETANAVANAPLSTSAQTQFYAKGAASTGLVYLSTFYAS